MILVPLVTWNAADCRHFRGCDGGHDLRNQHGNQRAPSLETPMRR